MPLFEGNTVNAVKAEQYEIKGRSVEGRHVGRIEIKEFNAIGFCIKRARQASIIFGA